MLRNFLRLPVAFTAAVALAATAAICLVVSTTTHAQAVSNPCRNEPPTEFVATIDNQFFPLRPGTTFIYTGTVEGASAQTVTQVTRDTKLIQGVRATVVHDVLYINAVRAEDTFDWYAQDRHGNVCYFGEDTKEFDETGQNVISTEGSWEAGKNGAQPGTIMLAAPERGDSYAQEHAPGVAEDQAVVVSLKKSVKVPYGSFKNVLLTRETTPLEPSNVGNKYYAPNVGLILDLAKKGGRERFELVSITME
jgi:hypothetical protein